MPYREFLLRELHPDVGPAEAERAYGAYLADFWGSAARADFERVRDDPAVRARFDPRDAAAKKLDRDASARAAAVEWLARYGAEGEAWVAPAAVDASAAGEGGGGGGGDGDGDGGDGAAPMDADAPASPPGSVPPEGRAGLASAGPTPRAGSARARRPPGAPPLARTCAGRRNGLRPTSSAPAPLRRPWTWKGWSACWRTRAATR